MVASNHKEKDGSSRLPLTLQASAPQTYIQIIMYNYPASLPAASLVCEKDIVIACRVSSLSRSDSPEQNWFCPLPAEIPECYTTDIF